MSEWPVTGSEAALGVPRIILTSSNYFWLVSFVGIASLPLIHTALREVLPKEPINPYIELRGCKSGQ